MPALSYGSQLAIGALGVTLIFAILRFSNFAWGDTMAFGTTVVIWSTWGLQAAGIGFGPLPTALLALPVGIAATAALVLATDKVVYQFYRKQKAKPIILVIVSAGVMFVMNGIVRVIIGTAGTELRRRRAVPDHGGGVQGRGPGWPRVWRSRPPPPSRSSPP